MGIALPILPFSFDVVATAPARFLDAVIPTETPPAHMIDSFASCSPQSRSVQVDRGIYLPQPLLTKEGSSAVRLDPTPEQDPLQHFERELRDLVRMLNRVGSKPLLPGKVRSPDYLAAMSFVQAWRQCHHSIDQAIKAGRLDENFGILQRLYRDQQELSELQRFLPSFVSAFRDLILAFLPFDTGFLLSDCRERVESDFTNSRGEMELLSSIEGDLIKGEYSSALDKIKRLTASAKSEHADNLVSLLGSLREKVLGLS